MASPNIAVRDGALSQSLAYKIDDLDLNVVGSKLRASIEGAIVSADLELTIEGASTVTIEVEDVGQRLTRSAVLRRWAWGEKYLDEKSWLKESRAVEIEIDGLFFRLVRVEKQQTRITLVFEDREVTFLRRHKGARKASRGRVTRAQFIDTLRREVKAGGGIKFHCPELKVKQPIKREKDKISERERINDAGPGISDGADLTVKGKEATKHQLRNMEIALDVADSMGASRRVTLALLVAAIGESDFKAQMNQAGSGYGGVWQGDVSANYSYFKVGDTADQAHYFLAGGKGFQAGGAIQAAKDHPEWTPGDIATNVEASGKAGSFYQAHINEAERILQAYDGNGITSSTWENVRQRYEFTRGKNETSWDAMGRLAEEVRWRRFMRRGTLWYASETRLFKQKPRTAIREGENGVDWIDYDIDMFARAKNPVGEITVSARASRWFVLPGQVFLVKGESIADGRWLVSSVKRSLTDEHDAVTVEARKPIPPLKEPDTEITRRETIADKGDGSPVETLYEIAKKFSGTYVYGGGHGPPLSSLRFSDGLDCSSSSSLALWKADMFGGTTAIVSGDFASSWGEPGKGRYFTVWANDGHVWIEFHHLKKYARLDTSQHPSSGPRLVHTPRSTAGFTPRHWPGS